MDIPSVKTGKQLYKYIFSRPPQIAEIPHVLCGLPVFSIKFWSIQLAVA